MQTNEQKFLFLAYNDNTKHQAMFHHQIPHQYQHPINIVHVISSDSNKHHHARLTFDTIED